ncbi:hypothetical protein ACVWYS_001412 [Arthrobacter sp. TE12231]
MTKKVRLAILRARHDSSPVFSDQAAISMMMTGANSVFSYWESTSCGYLDFVDSALMPWVKISVGADTGRQAQADAAIGAVRAKFPAHDPLAGFDGVIVLTYPGKRREVNPRAGQAGEPAEVDIGFDGGELITQGFPVAVIPVMTSDFTSMCHEVGHILGFEHTYGLLNNGADWVPTDKTIVVDTVYGSPFDLMSSASFGTRWLGTGPTYSASPTFNLPETKGWPNPAAVSAGPILSRANLHRWMPEALASRVIGRDFPTDGGTVQARLWSHSSKRGPVLLVLHPPSEPASGVGRVYVEYRPSLGWDQGLDILGPSLSREGVVVHSIADVQGAGPRVWYRGVVPSVSVDADVMVSNTPLAVEVQSFDPKRQWADVVVRMQGPPQVRIEQQYRSDDFVGVVGDTYEEKTPCGDSIRKGTFATSTVCQFHLTAMGLGAAGEPVAGPVTATWRVGGVDISGASGTVDVPYDGAQFTLEYTIDPVVFELALTSRGGERFDVPVEVRVSDQLQLGTAADAFSAQGWFEGIHPDDLAVLSACLERITKRYNIRQWVFRRPTPGPEWGEVGQWSEVVKQWGANTANIVDRVTNDVVAQNALRQIVQLQLPRGG